MVAEAQQKKAAVLGELEQEKTLLEQKIDQLRGFERTYRSQLKSYLQGQLNELDQTGVEPAETSASSDHGDADPSEGGDGDGHLVDAGGVNGQEPHVDETGHRSADQH